jgi:VWFA-related protein
MRTGTVALLILAIVSAPSAGGGQTMPNEPVQTTFGSEVELTVVNVDVFVRDRDGRPVEDLTASDFRVFQDDIEMPISNFSVQNRGHLSLEEGEPVGSRPQDSPSTVRPAFVLLYFDNEHLHPVHRGRVMPRLRGFVEQTMHGQVRMAVASARRSMVIRQPFTDDPEEVLAALDVVAHETSGLMVREADRKEILDAMHNDPFFIADQARPTIRAFADEESNVLMDSIAALRQSVTFMAGFDGRGSVVYVSSGVPMTPARGLIEEYVHVYKDPTFLLQMTQRHLGQDFRALALAAANNRVRLHAIDASGLTTGVGFRAEDVAPLGPGVAWSMIANNHESLSYMADTTGGLAVINTNDVEKGLGRIRDDLFNYYSLGYTIGLAEHENDHTIKVELRQHPRYEVRHQRWFTEKSDSTRIDEQVRSALMRDIENNTMNLVLRCGEPRSTAGKNWLVPVDLVIPVGHLTMIPEGDEWVGRVELFVGARDERGREMKPWHREHEIRVPASGSALPTNARHRVSFDLLMRSQNQTVAVGILDTSSKSTSIARTTVRTPSNEPAPKQQAGASSG